MSLLFACPSCYGAQGTWLDQGRAVNDPDWLYNATDRPGVARFEPRPYWQLDDYARSGSAADPAKVPPGAVVFQGVYAIRESFVPFYHPPRHCPRLSLDPRANEASLPVLHRYIREV